MFWKKGNCNGMGAWAISPAISTCNAVCCRCDDYQDTALTAEQAAEGPQGELLVGGGAAALVARRLARRRGRSCPQGCSPQGCFCRRCRHGRIRRRHSTLFGSRRVGDERRRAWGCLGRLAAVA